MRRLLVVVLIGLTLTACGYERAVSVATLGQAKAEASTGDRDTRHLEPGLRLALEHAIASAAADGVTVRLTSGWRSPATQQRLFEAAVRKYGSPERASHWVLPPDQSAHVKGAAVDVAPRAGAAWLERHGAQFGLCRRYQNEWWHFELLTSAGGTCPALAAHAGS